MEEFLLNDSILRDGRSRETTVFFRRQEQKRLTESVYHPPMENYFYIWAEKQIKIQLKRLKKEFIKRGFYKRMYTNMKKGIRGVHVGNVCIGYALGMCYEDILRFTHHFQHQHFLEVAIMDPSSLPKNQGSMSYHCFVATLQEIEELVDELIASWKKMSKTERDQCFR